MAEREGFEPPEVLPSTVFKTAAIDHSATSPGGAGQQDCPARRSVRSVAFPLACQAVRKAAGRWRGPFLAGALPLHCRMRDVAGCR